MKTKQVPDPAKQYLCTSCGKDAFIGYGKGWQGLVKAKERLCSACFRKRSGFTFL